MAWTATRDWTVGELITEAMLDEQIKGNMDYLKGFARWTIVRKTANETINNSSTFQDDDHLKFAIAASEEWIFDIQLFWVSNTTADFKVAVTVPAGASMKVATDTVIKNALDGIIGGYLITTSGADIANYAGAICHLWGWVLNSTTAGFVQLQWAQNTATVVDTTVYQGSFLKAYKIS